MLYRKFGTNPIIYPKAALLNKTAAFLGCGTKGPIGTNPLLRSAGGKMVQPHEWPWMVFMNLGTKKDLRAAKYICGGSLISSRYVLTAAHCLTASGNPSKILKTEGVHPWIGAHNRGVSNSATRYVEAEQFIVHPNYHENFYMEYDVGLIRLSSTINMTDDVRPICLPMTPQQRSILTDGATGYVAGWGLYDEGFASSRTLRDADFPVVTNGECQTSLVGETTNARYRITENMFCAGYNGADEGDQATCSGDSGGPFMMSDSSPDETYYALGTVSFGSNGQCGRQISYTAYTRLSKEIIDWIVNNTNNLE